MAVKKLYDYQQAVVDRAEKQTALFWDMGLGKTVTSLEIYKKFKLKRLFVLCPVSMVEEWCQEFESQVGGKAIPYKKIKGNILEDNEIECIVLNYDMVWRNKMDYSFIDRETMIICDESHRFKNPLSKVGKYMKFLKVKTEYKICLTGTPQSQGYIDYYNQLYFLDMLDMTFAKFKSEFCVYQDQFFNGVKIKSLVGYQNVGILKKYYLDKCEFLKIERVYDDVIKHNYIKLKVSNEYKRVKNDRVVYKDFNDNIVTDRKLISEFLNGDDRHIQDFKFLDNIGAFRMGLRQLLDSKYKQDWIRTFLEDYDKRVVIYYNFNKELDSLEKILKKMKRPYSIYNGAVKSFDNFKQNENGVALCNYKSGSVGINDLVISNIFIAYSPSENYIEWEQSKKRIDRNGQVNTPIYYFLESGFESKIYETLRTGKSFDDAVFCKLM